MHAYLKWLEMYIKCKVITENVWKYVHVHARVKTKRKRKLDKMSLMPMADEINDVTAYAYAPTMEMKKKKQCDQTVQVK